MAAARVCLPRKHTAVPVWLRTELYHIYFRQTECRSREDLAERRCESISDRDELGKACGRSGRADVHPPWGEQRCSTGPRIARVQARASRARSIHHCELRCGSGSALNSGCADTKDCRIRSSRHPCRGEFRGHVLRPLDCYAIAPRPIGATRSIGSGRELRPETPRAFLVGECPEGVQI